MKNASLLAVLGLAIVFTAGLHAQDHGQARVASAPAAQKPDHMEHSFADAERYAKSFDDPARDAWQMPDQVIAALGLKSGQTVADIGAGPDTSRYGSPNQRPRQRCTRSISKQRWSSTSGTAQCVRA